jgi:hypothetical protein
MVSKKLGRQIIDKHKLLGRQRSELKKEQLGRHALDAKLSKDAYEKKRNDYNEWMLEKYHNNREHGVWINNKTKEIKVAFRGTDNLGDVKTDAYLAVGKLKSTDRFKKEDNLIQQLKRMYPNYKITVTGHSLGGALASEISNKYNLEGSGFNSGQGIRGKINNSNFQQYRTSTDPVSLLGDLRGEKSINVEGFGHGVDNFQAGME